MLLVNLTPHPVTIEGGPFPLTLQPSGPAPRLTVSRRTLAPLTWPYHIPVTAPTLGAVEGLPAPREGVFLIVSAMVAEACPAREDLLSPGEAVRDPSGIIIGCKGLSAGPGYARAEAARTNVGQLFAEHEAAQKAEAARAASGVDFGAGRKSDGIKPC